jgi:murein tripeptide amidase MpaA
MEFDRYYDAAQTEAALKGLADAYPELASLHNIGTSLQGRGLWLIEITNKATGDPGDKPGYYIDGVTHAEEVSGAVVSLYTAWYLLSHYGQEEMVTRLLDWQTFYILPVVNPDGMEIALKDTYHEWIGNGRYMPGEDQFGPGLHYADVNGDGFVSDMRIRDDRGEWKISEQDPRILVHRELWEHGGEYYRLLPEGEIEDFEGVDALVPQPQDGNLNRNYPYAWGPENEQYGAGEHPLSEPEIMAITRFVLDHPNIHGAVNYHTNAGVILLPFEVPPGGTPYEDTVVFKRIGEMGAETTGYGLLADEKDFNIPNVPRRLGTSGGFLYVQRGIMGIVTELWDVYAEAGIEKDWFFPIQPLDEEESLKLLKWSDEQLDGEGFMDWTPFEHPQLGPVELGGWKRLFMFRNPPAHHLPDMCHKNMMFTLKHALTAPRLNISGVEITKVDADLYKVEAIVENLGYLPTYVSRRAIDAKVVTPVTAELVLDDGVELVAGKLQQDLDHLSGRSERGMQYSRFINWHKASKKAEWVVRVRNGGSAEITVKALSQRAGQDARTVNLG